MFLSPFFSRVQIFLMETKPTLMSSTIDPRKDNTIDKPLFKPIFMGGYWQTQNSVHFWTIEPIQVCVCNRWRRPCTSILLLWRRWPLRLNISHPPPVFCFGWTHVDIIRNRDRPAKMSNSCVVWPIRACEKRDWYFILYKLSWTENWDRGGSSILFIEWPQAKYR